MRVSLQCLIVVSSLAIAATAHAEPTQTVVPISEAAHPPQARNIYSGNYLVIGVGVANVPTFEGGRERGIYPAAGLMARYRGISIRSRGMGVAFDILHKPDYGRIGFSFGPVVRWRGSGGGRMRDPVLAQLGKRRGNVEAGINAGVHVKHVFNHYDSLNLGVDMRWDASRGTGGRVISVGPSYFTPVSKRQVVGLSGTMDFVNHPYSSGSYGITPAGSAASGLQPYAARSGLKSIGFKTYTAYDLDGNIANGGFAVGAAIGYTLLTGSAADSPITRVRGRRSGLLLAAGIGYAF